jgi:adenylate kinase family enzyme
MTAVDPTRRLPPPQRVLVVGGCGAGKTTLARRLAPILDLPAVHLDRAYWQPNWREPDRDHWRDCVAEIIAADRWIIDGNYSNTLDLRLPRADWIILLDLPTWQCLWSAVWRCIRHFGRVRSDVGPGCRERPSLEFFHYVATFRRDRRDELHAHTRTLADHQCLFILRSRRQIEDFARQIEVRSVAWPRPIPSRYAAAMQSSARTVSP